MVVSVDDIAKLVEALTELLHDILTVIAALVSLTRG